MRNNILIATLALSMCCLVQNAYGEQDREDYDIDDDGLIEINDIADLKQIIKSNPKFPNKTLYESDAGCPAPYCFGYELSRDLDFDAGVMSNPLKNFSPIHIFTGVFEGNGFRILNMRLRAGLNEVGLFGYARHALVKDLHLGGEASSLIMASEHRGSGGVIATRFYNSYLVNSTVNSRIESVGGAGGLFAVTKQSTIFNSHFKGKITGLQDSKFATRFGGLIGLAYNTKIIASSFIGSIKGSNDTSSAFALQKGKEPGSISHSYAVIDKDSARVITPNPMYEQFQKFNNFFIVELNSSSVISANEAKQKPRSNISLSDFQCHTSFDDPDCKPIFSESWASGADDFGNPLWRFGAANELPQLNPNLQFDYEAIDIDGDGVIHSEDAFPYDKEYTQDNNFDGIPDNCIDPCTLYVNTKTSDTSKPEDTSDNKETKGSADSAGAIGLSSLFSLIFIAIFARIKANLAKRY